MPVGPLLIVALSVATLVGAMVTVRAVGVDYRGGPTTTCTIAAASDIARQGGDQKETAAIVTSLNPSAVVLLGDNAYPRGSSDDYANYYAPSWGKFAAITKPAPGNSDYYTDAASGYFDYFVGTPQYYSYDLCAWHIYSLNNELTGGARDAELTWLEDDLAAHPDAPKLAVWHEPRWTSGSSVGPDPQSQDLWDTVTAGGVRVVLSGHERVYERLTEMDSAGVATPNGTRLFVVGDGTGYTTSTAPLVTTEKRLTGIHGVMSMTLRPDGYDWSLHQQGGGVVDSGSQHINRPGSGPSVASTPLAAGPPRYGNPSPANPTPTSAVPKAGRIGRVIKPSPTPSRSASASSGQPAARTGTITVVPIADTYVSEGGVDDTHDDHDYVRVGYDDEGERRSYLKFIVQGIPSDATSVSATLTMTGYDDAEDTMLVALQPDTSWQESSLTWNNQPYSDVYAINYLTPRGAGVAVSTDVSAAVQADGTYGFVLLAPDADLEKLDSRESDHPPLLQVRWSI
jgi:hypothetical protein